MNMPQGKIKWFSTDQGYGFIEQENGNDLFVHANDVQEGSLQEGDSVEFEIGDGQKGPCAKDVRTV
jgi:CspA family cold shock protein